ncbi:hypothetical protein FCL55_00965 [Mycoplasma bovis]|nr:hypothetical protein [Mycoplasmopsis bovis]
MKNYFNIDNISHLKQYAPVVITNEELENNFNSIANSYEDELDKLAYVELIKQITKNMTHLEDYINKNIYKSIYHEDDLDKLAGYYKLSENLIDDDSYEANDLGENFLNNENIYKVDDLWEKVDYDLKIKGMEANIYLANDLLSMHEDIEWVKLNAHERAEAIEDINKEFEDWFSRQDLEKYLSAYDKDDFIDEFKLEEKLEKEKLEAKDEKTKALVM